MHGLVFDQLLVTGQVSLCTGEGVPLCVRLPVVSW